MAWAVFDEAASSGVSFSTITDPSDGLEYRLATVTAAGTLEWASLGDFEWRGAAGGGAGGADQFNKGAGGGSGGEVDTGTATATAALNINIGLGGDGARGSEGAPASGGDTTVTGGASITLKGGGRGGGGDGPEAGAYGGGRSARDTTTTGLAGLVAFRGGLSWPGFNNNTETGGGGGGGGAGGDGGDHTTDQFDGAGQGGPGDTSTFTGVSEMLGAGGSGSDFGSNTVIPAPSGAGEGGAGSRDATDGTGAGGGGADGDKKSGDGGDGIVYVRVETRPPSTGTRVHGLRLLSPALLDAAGLENLVATEAATYHVSSFTPASLFSSGEVGDVWNPYDGTKTFTTSGGSTLAGLGDPVGRINGLAGNHNLIQAASGSRPTLGASTRNLEWDGVDDGMYLSSISLASKVATFAITLESGLSQTTAAQVLAELSESSDSTNAAFSNAVRPSSESEEIGGGLHDSGFRGEQISGVLSSQPVTLFAEYDNSTTSGNIRFWANTTELSTVVNADEKSGTNDFAASQTFNLGARAASGTIDLPAAFSSGPAMLINRALTAQERSDYVDWVAGL